MATREDGRIRWQTERRWGQGFSTATTSGDCLVGGSRHEVDRPSRLAWLAWRWAGVGAGCLSYSVLIEQRDAVDSG